MNKLRIRSIIDDIVSPSMAAYIIIDFYDDDGKLIKQKSRKKYVAALKLFDSINSHGKTVIPKNTMLLEEHVRGPYKPSLPIYFSDKTITPTIEEYMRLSAALKENNICFNKKKGVLLKGGKEMDNKIFLDK